MNKPSFYEWSRPKILQANSFGRLASEIGADRFFPKTETDYHGLLAYVKANYVGSRDNYLPFPTEVFDRMYIAYAIEWFEDYKPALKAHVDRANGKGDLDANILLKQ